MNVHLVSELGEFLVGTVEEVLSGSPPGLPPCSGGVGQSLGTFLCDHVAEMMSDVDDEDRDGELDLVLRVR